ncbi:hypothetical protein [Gemmata sp.]|uniref:hypothetical protein n=1 Tax=Gemmata sp. TaxID=1914242 RepID=UPI003F71AB25
MSLPTAEWTAALDRMAAALDQTLGDLDRHREGWAAVTDTPARAAPPDLMTWLETRLGQWDARLTAAADLAATVEGQLGEREAVVGRWAETFGRWQKLVEQGAGAPSTNGVAE